MSPPRWKLILVILSLVLGGGNLVDGENFALVRTGFSQEVQKGPENKLDCYGDPLPPGAIARVGTIRFRHHDMIRSLSYSSNSKLLASGSMDGTARIWEAATGKLIRQLGAPLAPSPEPPEMNCVAFSSDGKTIATGGWSGVVRFWDVETGKEIVRLRKDLHSGIQTLRWCSDKGIAAAGGGRYGIHVWGEQVLNTKGEGQTLTISGDATRIAFARDQDDIVVWDLTNNKPVVTIERDPDKDDKHRPPGLALSADGKTLAALRWRGIVLYDAATGKEIRRLANGAYCVAFSPDGKSLAGGYPDITLWEVATGKELRTFSVPDGSVRWLVFAPDGKSLAWSSGNRVLHRLDLSTGKESPLFEAPPSAPSTFFTPDGRGLITLWGVTRRAYWSLPAAKKEKEVLHRALGRLEKAALSLDGERIAWSNGLGPRGLYDLYAAKLGAKDPDFWQASKVPFQASKVPFAGFFLGNNYLVAAAGEEIIQWDLDKKVVLNRFKQKGPIEALVPSANRRIFAALDRKGWIGVWQIGVPDALTLFQPSEGAKIAGLGLSTSGRYVSFVEDGRTYRIWDTFRQRGIFEKNLLGGYSIAPSADGKLLAIVYRDGALGLWEVATGKEICRVPGHDTWASPTFSVDGKLLATTGRDTAVLVWDVASLAGSGAANPLAKKDLNRLWNDLGGDPKIAYKALFTMAAAKETLGFLASRLQPEARADLKRLGELAANMDANDPAISAKAVKDLIHMGSSIEVYLRRMLSEPVSQRKRDNLLLVLTGFEKEFSSADYLRKMRTIQLVEQIGSNEALQLLKQLTAGESLGPLTEDARAAIDRIQWVKQQRKVGAP